MSESLHRRLLLSSTIRSLDEPQDGDSRICMRAVMEGQAFRRLLAQAVLPVALGRTPSGADIALDLAAMPHLLIGGTLGSGKSACINAVISSFLCTNTPDTLQMLMIDPKGSELTGYNGMPHLLAPTVVDPGRVVGTLMWLRREVEERYRRFAKVGARDIEDFNRRVVASEPERMPYIIVFVDELADLMMAAPDDVEKYICGIAQNARNAGTHLVASTARPDRQVVTNSMDALFPARICFAVPTSTESRAVLGQDGAEWLSSPGEMLLRTPDIRYPARLRGCLVSRSETTRLVDHWVRVWSAPLASVEEAHPEDELMGKAIELVRSEARASVTLLQRRLRIDYARASRIIEVMRERGIVGPDQGGSRPRLSAFGKERNQKVGAGRIIREADLLDRARGAIEAGDRALAARLLIYAIRVNEHSEEAWLWFSDITQDVEIARECLERVLLINPENEVARGHLDRLASVERLSVDDEPQSVDERPLVRGLQSFMGQRAIVTDLVRRIALAQQRGDPLEHLLFCGPAEMGKAALVQAIAEEMEVDCKQVDAKAIKQQEDLARIVTALHKADVLNITEIGSLAAPIAELLGGCLQDCTLSMVIGRGEGARPMGLPLPQFTLIGTSSSPSLIDRKLRRWFVAYDLAPYSQAELADILALLARRSDLQVDSGVTTLLAAHCEGLPGYAAFLLDRVAGFCRARGEVLITDSATQEALLLFGYLGRPESSVDLAQRLRMMDGTEFERSVATLFRDMGYEVELTGQSGDHGIDLIITRGKEQIAIQCKAWAGPVGEPVVRDFYGSLLHLGAKLGCIITTASFTAEAHSFARGKPVKLIGLDKLVALAIGRRSQGK